MTDDARFEDGAERPLRLWAQDAEDLVVVSALVQDAVFPGSEMVWRRPKRQFAVLLNRFRWEDAEAARLRGRPVERVQSLLEVSDVTAVRSQGLDRRETDVVLSVLALEWQAGEDGTGTLTLTLAGDGAVALEVECLDVRLTDVTRPYRAPSGRSPQHPED
jgi:hypothetical protein